MEEYKPGKEWPKPEKEFVHWFVIPVLIALLIIIPTERYKRTIPLRPSTGAASQFATILCDQFKNVPTISANTQIITAGNANMFIYICSYNLSASAAITFSIVEGTGTTCTTNTAGMVGGATAATGPSLGIAGTINYGGGTGAVTKTAVAGDNVCIFPSAGNLSGVVSWTSAPF